MTAKELETLEDLIDKFGLSDVLSNLAGIAGEKADHILANYDDEELSDEWNAAADELDTLADAIDLPGSD